MDKGIIFVSGVHGVGKSTLCTKLSNKTGIPFLSASTIIREFKAENENINRLNAEVMSNAKAFNLGVKELLKKNDYYIIDGHTILLDENGDYIPIPPNIFSDLPIIKFVTMYNDLSVIGERMSNDIPKNMDFLREFQNLELNQSLFISQQCNFELEYFHSSGSLDDFSSIFKCIESTA
ncbi:ATP-binding protein [Vibrio parahaemolyticus]|uniref:ATP-binding protein n=1 Tax=Vibrio parahaemolyticus TaxID=670 RepID=UPI00186A7621|nr:ATP-binding protein [Vibrio parahaemolyticus]MBE3686819.1 AAA family ATPase [Vibrio parahaemolyticus]